MKKSFAGLGLASLALVLAAPAQAGVSEDFAGCDGLKKPKRSDDGMRGEATLPGGGSVFFRQNNAPDPQSIIASCNRALETGKLRPEQTLRRAHIMRARAAAYLRLDDAQSALADLDAADAAGAAYEGDFFYERSMGVSLDLLRAIALNALDRREEAIALARSAQAKRPFALPVQRAATLLQAGAEEAARSPETWHQLGLIDPATRNLSDAMVGDTEGLAVLAASAGEPSIVMPDPPSVQEVMASGGNATALMGRWTKPIADAMRTAYALAANGQGEQAKRWVEEARLALEPDTDAEDGTKPTSLIRALTDMAKNSAYDPMVKLVEGRLAISEGRLEDAAAALNGMSLGSAPLTDEFYAAYAAAAEANPADAPALPPLGERPQRLSPRLTALADSLLMRPESERKLIDYKKSRPDILGALVGGAFSLGTSLLGGIQRTSGFKETENADGSITVEYTGDTTSGAVVQEMTLLRAAEIAQAASKSHFHISGRNDFQKYLSMTQYGIEQSRRLTGYKTELVVILLDSAEDRPNAVDAVSVIDALGPIYYGD